VGMGPSAELEAATGQFEWQHGEIQLFPEKGGLKELNVPGGWVSAVGAIITLAGIGLALMNREMLFSSGNLGGAMLAVAAVFFLVVLVGFGYLALTAGSRNRREANERIIGVFRPFAAMVSPNISDWAVSGKAGENLFFKLRGDPAAYALRYCYLHKEERLGTHGSEAVFGYMLERLEHAYGKESSAAIVEPLMGETAWRGDAKLVKWCESKFPIAGIGDWIPLERSPFASELNGVVSGAGMVYGRFSFPKTASPEMMAKFPPVMKEMARLASGR